MQTKMVAASKLPSCLASPIKVSLSPIFKSVMAMFPVKALKIVYSLHVTFNKVLSFLFSVIIFFSTFKIYPIPPVPPQRSQS